VTFPLTLLFQARWPKFDPLAGWPVRMSQFVNYQKRGITLPTGCKNLVDVLQPPSRRRELSFNHGVAPDGQPFEIKKQWYPGAGIAQLGRFLPMLLRSRKELFVIDVSEGNFEWKVTLYRSRAEQVVAIAMVACGAKREQDIRAYFEQQSVRPIHDFMLSDLRSGNPERGLVYPLPFDAANAFTLTTELLRDVYAVSDEAGLEYCYYETDAIES
jgi:hypothetical protein